MAKRKGSGTPSRAKGGNSGIRAGSVRQRITNSGLEVWLYDDANCRAIRGEKGAAPGFGGMPGNFETLTRHGLVVGYSLMQDDELDVAVVVGDPLTELELTAARWLEPQTAFLRLPSGRLCIESNDASRIGPENPTARGGIVDVPPGDYRLTLYRIDHEALDRERRTWGGPQEVIVLTPGGRPSEAAGDLLPFEPRRDLTWVGKYKVDGRRAEALAWFSDYWDTFVLNLDRAAASKMSLNPGSYFRTHVPSTGITLVSVFAGSWDEGKRLPLPSGTTLDEYGYASFVGMSGWNSTEALFCRRDTAKSRVEAEHHNVWIPAVVEILDVQPETPVPAGERFVATDLRNKNYFDAGFLSLILSDLIPEFADRDDLDLPGVLDVLDAKLGKAGLAPQEDLSWEDREGPRGMEASCRMYTGLPDSFAALVLREGVLAMILLSELADESWVVTGLADDLEGRIEKKGKDGLPVPNPRVHLELMDEPLAKIFKAHQASLKKSASLPVPAPTNLEEAIAAFERFLTAAFD